MQHALGILESTAGLWMEMGLYLLFGYLCAGILSRVLKASMIARHLGHNRLWAVAKASILGVPLPLCSCGVIPVGLSLYRRGASRASTTSFLISTPQTGVDSLLVTYAMLGPVFMIVRPIFAFFNGLLGGGIVAFLEKETTSPPLEGEDRPHASLPEHIFQALRYGFLEFPRQISKWLVIGIAIAGVVAYFLPTEEKILGKYLGSGLLPMVVMAVAGIPFYICSTSSVPFVAVLMANGLSPGAALVFLVTGPATNTATLVLLARELGKKATAIYLGSIVVTSFFAGFVLEWFYRFLNRTPQIPDVMAHEHFGIWQILGGIALALVTGIALWRNLAEKRRNQHQPERHTESSLDIKVSGMTCDGCARHVSKAAMAVEGVRNAHVNLKAGILHVQGEKPDLDAIKQSVQQSGYSIDET